MRSRSLRHWTCLFFGPAALAAVLASTRGEEGEKKAAPLMLPGHSGVVHSLAFSPDGKLLVSCGGDRTVRVWSTSDGKEAAAARRFENAIRAVVCHPRLRIVAAADGHVIRVWDPMRKEESRTLQGHTDSIVALAFSDDGRTLASGGADKSVRLWSMETGKELTKLEGHEGRVAALAFTSDGKTLAAAGEGGTVKLWDLATRMHRDTLKGHAASITALAYSRSGVVLATSSMDGSVRLWSTASNKQAMVFDGHKGGVVALAFSSDGRTIAAAGQDGTVKLWDWISRLDRLTLDGLHDPVTALAFTPNGRLLAIAGQKGSVQLHPMPAVLALPTAADYEALTHGLKHGLVLEKQGNFKEALGLYEKTLVLARRMFGTRHVTIAVLHDAMGKCHAQMGDTRRGVGEYERGLAVWEKLPGKHHATMADSAIILSGLYKGLAELDRAVPLAERALKLRLESPERNDLKVASAEYHLASFYLLVGRHGEARPLLQRALQTREKRLGAQSKQVGLVLNSFGFLHFSLGQFSQAETHFQRSWQIVTKAFPRDLATEGNVANNLGLLYASLGQYERAEEWLRRALERMEKANGANDPETANVSNSLAYLYLTTQQFAKAEELLRRSLKVLEDQNGPDHPNVAVALVNLSYLFQEKKDYSQASRLLDRARKIMAKSFGTDHPAMAICLNNQAGLALRSGDLTQAAKLNEQSFTIIENRYGKDHPAMSLPLRARVVLAGLHGRWEEAAEAAESDRRLLREHVRRVLPVLSDSEQLRFLKTADADSLHLALNLALKNPGNRTLAQRSAGWVLNGKAVGQEALAERALLAQASGDPQRGELVRKLVQVRTRLANLTLDKARLDKAPDHRKDMQQLLEQERDLSGQVGRLEGNPLRVDTWVELDQVRKALPDEAVLIEIVKVRAWDFKARNPAEAWKAPRYVAWLIRPAKRGDIRVVDLGDAERIENAVENARHVLLTSSRGLTRANEQARTAEARKALDELAGLILQPLLEHIGAAPRWIISPDADLWLVPWAALPIKDAEYAIEKHTIHFVTSGRDLVSPGVKVRTEGALVIADPDYDLPLDEVARETVRVLKKQTAPIRGLELRSLSLKGVRWNRLQGTADEARAIAPGVEKLVGKTPQVYTEKRALEGVFKAAVHPRVVVLSTHGFFLEDQEAAVAPLPGQRGLDLIEEPAPRPKTRRKGKDPAPLENPLLRCGLAFAGANHLERVQGIDGDDGILTGLEIVGSNLRGTELVVLSACETGLGRVHNGEGVAGLRQAFHLAGARTVVATLWQIPDRETVDLMKHFFSALPGSALPGEADRADALRRAQLEIIQARRKKNGAAHPFYWAAFTLTGQAR